MDSEQAAIWNGDAGKAWVETKTLLDEMFRPFERMLAEAIPLRSQWRVLDVGCGTGSTTLAVADRLVPPGLCLGVDVSAPMIAEARAYKGLAPADFVCCDVQRHSFAPQSLDAVVSRFGVMFFDDPVAAFASLRQAARPGAPLHFFAWRAPADNPFMTAAERAVAPLLPPAPARAADAPGQFAFARRERVADILGRAGWTGIEIAPVDVACAFARQDLPAYVRRMGSVGRVLPGLSEAMRETVIERALAAFAPFERDGMVRHEAACWEVRARA